MFVYLLFSLLYIGLSGRLCQQFADILYYILRIYVQVDRHTNKTYQPAMLSSCTNPVATYT